MANDKPIYVHDVIQNHEQRITALETGTVNTVFEKVVPKLNEHISDTLKQFGESAADDLRNLALQWKERQTALERALMEVGALPKTWVLLEETPAPAPAPSEPEKAPPAPQSPSESPTPS